MVEEIMFKHSSIPCTQFDLPIDCNNSLASTFDRKQVGRIPERMFGVELGRPPSLSFVSLPVLVNQQV